MNAVVCSSATSTVQGITHFELRRGYCLTPSSIALRMRRPNLLQWTSGMSDCLDVLENSPEVSLLDKRLAAWVRLQNIVDDWSKSVGLINSHVELSLKGFERQLQKWREVAEPGVINSKFS